MPFNRPTLSELVAQARDDIDTRLPGADSRVRRNALDVLASIIAGGLHGLYGLLDYIWRQIFPDSAEAENMARWAAIWGVARKAASAATGTAEITGVNGSVLPEDTLLVRSDGAEYRAIASATIVAGIANVAVEATAPGTKGNAPAGQKLNLVSPVAGIGSIATLTAGATTGANEESDDSLRSRLLTRIQQPPHGGNRQDYINWALEVPGVTRAWVSPGELGIGSVTLRFVMDGRPDIIPLPGDIEVVQDYIDSLRPVTANVTVVAPIPRPFAFTLRTLPNSAPVRAAVEEELRDLIRREAEPGGTLLVSHIREAISLAAGELDNETVVPVADIEMPTGEMTTFGSVVFV
jgi:uncharacterized phage protein gp47/JayE